MIGPLNTYVHKQHYMDSTVCVHGYVHMDTHRCIYVTIIIKEDEANTLRGDIERVEREGNYVNIIFIHEIFKK